jgi:hypothetical protein
MTEEAASRFEIGVEPRFPPDILRSLRNEVDALLGFLALAISHFIAELHIQPLFRSARTRSSDAL